MEENAFAKGEEVGRALAHLPLVRAKLEALRYVPEKHSIAYFAGFMSGWQSRQKAKV